MKDFRPLFPSLSSEASHADLQVRQTLAMGLVPMGIAGLMVALTAPAWPPIGLWLGTGTGLAAMAALWNLFRRSGGRYQRGFSAFHFAVRYLFLILCPGLMWTVYGNNVLDISGLLPPVLVGLLLLVYPVGRILREQIGPDPAQSPRLEMLCILCQQVEMALAVIAVIGIVTGAVLDANKDVPSDPTALLILLWMFAVLAVLGAAVLVAAHWIRLFGRVDHPQPLDDPPPRTSSPNTLRFGSEKF